MAKKLYVVCAPVFPTNSGYKQSVLGRVYESAMDSCALEILSLNNESNSKAQDRRVPDGLRNVQYKEVLGDEVRKPIPELINLFTREPRIARIFSTKRFRTFVEDAIQSFRPDEIVAESIWALCAINPQYWHRVNLVIHDVTSQMLEASLRGERSLVRKIYHWRDLNRCDWFEESIFHNFPGNLTFLTKEDRDFYRQKFSLLESQCHLASNRLMTMPVVRKSDPENKFLLFPGSIEFHQNLAALTWMAKEVWPLLKKLIVDVPFVAVTGRASEKRRNQLNKLGMPIKWMGEVDFSELDALYGSCLCVVSPIISGTGIKIKILEAVAKGVPVVATGLSARGIDSPLCYRSADDDAASFSIALSEFLTKESGAAELTASRY